MAGRELKNSWLPKTGQLRSVFNNMNIARPRRSSIAFSAAAVVLLGVAALVVVTTQRFLKDSEWSAHTADILVQVDSLEVLHRGAISSQRGYLLLGRTELRNEFWDARARLPLQLQRLAGSVRNPAAAIHIAAVGPLLRKRFEIAATAMAVFEKQGLDQARTYIAGNGGYELDEKIRRSIDQTRAIETRLLTERRAITNRSGDWLLLVSLLGIPFSLLVLGLVQRFLMLENAERRRSESAAQAAAVSFETLSARSESLSQYTGMLQTCTDSDELLSLSGSLLSQMVPGVAGTLYLTRASRDHAEIAAQWGQHLAPSAEMPAPDDCWSMRRNRTFTCDDVAQQICCKHVDSDAISGTVATACLPLSAHGELLGWLYLSGAGHGPLPGIGQATQAVEQLSLALANMRLKDDLLRQSIRDPLTGLFNRRYLEESLGREIARCQRRKLPLAVLMLDLDHFKTFNDQHGHPGGDALLSAFGRLLQSSCRPEDIACRFGGEEFVLVLPEADPDIGMDRARSILTATAQMVVAHIGRPLGRVTASIGVATMPDDGNNASTLLELADKALYAAKRAGRNQVQRAAPKPADR